MNLSIIVPVYNVEKYLSRCLDSILKQNFSGKFEVIVINDASPDKCSEILERYSKTYDNLKVLELIQNSSLAVARKKGMDMAIGEYILHVDSDDWIKPNMLEKLFDYIKEYKCPDVIVFNHERNDGEKTLQIEKKIEEQEIVDFKNKLTVQHLFMGGCCNKLVKRNVVVDIIYGETFLNTTEDLIYCTEVFQKSNNFLLVPDVFYCYFVNRKSLTSSITPVGYLRTQILIYELLTEIKVKYDLSLKSTNNINDYLDNFLVLEFFKNHMTKCINNGLVNQLKRNYISFSNEERFLELEKVYNSIIYAVKKIGLMSAIKLFIRLKFHKYVRYIYN